jgi:hypothetical protein
MSAQDALARRIRELYAAHGETSLAALSAKIRYDRAGLSKAMSGTSVPSVPLVKQLDEHWRTGGELARLRRTLVSGDEEEVSPTDRRDALRLLVLGPAAADLSRRIASADPDPLTGVHSRVAALAAPC